MKRTKIISIAITYALSALACGAASTDIYSTTPEKLSLKTIESNVKEHPKEARAYWLRGNYYERAFEPERAIADYTTALKLDPKMIKAQLGRAHSWAQLEQFEKSVADLKVVASSADAVLSNQALRDMFEMYSTMHNYEEAMKIFDRIFPKDKNFSNVRNVEPLVDGFLKQGKIDLASKYALIAVTHSNHSWQAHFGMAKCHAAKKEWKPAIEQLNIAIQQNPRSHDLYAARAAAYDAIGKKQLADVDRKYAKANEKQVLDDAPFRIH